MKLAHAAIAIVLAACGPHVLSTYGDRCGVNRDPEHPCRRRDTPHDGIDFGPASVGDPVIASADGVVAELYDDPNAGIQLVLAHGGYPLDATGAPYRTGYLHLRSARVRLGERVRRGDVIGELGLFRLSTGIVHVHWRLYGRDGTIDPKQKVVGCYDADHAYSRTSLELTYPLRC